MTPRGGILNRGAMAPPKFRAGGRGRRRERAWWINALARRSGLSSGTISKLLAGRGPHPSHKTMAQIAPAPGLPPGLVEPDYPPADVPDTARPARPPPPPPAATPPGGPAAGARRGA